MPMSQVRSLQSGRPDMFLITRRVKCRASRETITAMMHRLLAGRPNPRRKKFAQRPVEMRELRIEGQAKQKGPLSRLAGRVAGFFQPRKP